MCTWISYPITMAHHNLCATQVPSIGCFLHLLVTGCIWPQWKPQWLPHSAILPFMDGCFGLGSSTSQECARDFCWGLVQGNWYWKHKGKVTFLPTPTNQDLLIAQGSILATLFPLPKGKTRTWMSLWSTLSENPGVYLCAATGMPPCHSWC